MSTTINIAKERITAAAAHHFPLVSVLIAAYNHERFVRQAVESVLQQTYKNIELIVIDDGSSDRTFEIIEASVQDAPCVITALRNSANEGICRTLNKALSISTGEWIASLSSDDYFAPNFIEVMIEAARQRNFAPCVYHSDAINITESGRMLHRLMDVSKLPPAQGRCFWQIAEGRCKIVSSTCFAPRRLYACVGGFDETLVAEDFDIHLRMARITEFVYVDAATFFSRTVSGSLGRQTRKWEKDIFIALRKHEDLWKERIDRICETREVALYTRFMEEGDIEYAATYFRRMLRRQGQLRFAIFLCFQLAAVGLWYGCIGILRRNCFPSGIRHGLRLLFQNQRTST